MWICFFVSDFFQVKVSPNASSFSDVIHFTLPTAGELCALCLMLLCFLCSFLLSQPHSLVALSPSPSLFEMWYTYTTLRFEAPLLGHVVSGKLLSGCVCLCRTNIIRFLFSPSFLFFCFPISLSFSSKAIPQSDLLE